jgi:hypothetical protein
MLPQLLLPLFQVIGATTTSKAVSSLSALVLLEFF